MRRAGRWRERCWKRRARGCSRPWPDFSAETHKRWRPKLARLVELVAARDIAGLRAFEIKPISSSPKALARYRDAAVAAIEATPRRPA